MASGAVEVTVQPYTEALRVYALEAREEALEDAGVLGRRLLGEGVGIVEVVEIHGAAMGAVERDGDGRVAARGRRFLAEALRPFEVTFRGLQGALERLGELNRTLEREVADRTAELEGSIGALGAADQERRDLLARLMSAQEEERRRISADIHDDPIQVMAAASLRLGILRSRLTDPADAQLLVRVEETVLRAVGRLRRLLFELRPPALEREGLGAALRQHLDQIAPEAGFDYELSDTTAEELPVEVRVGLYRAVQEALMNVRKHAEATHVRVSIREREGGIEVRVVDDGVGFDPHALEQRAGHLGLTSMRERAQMAGGWCLIEGRPAQGTVVELWIPGADAVGEGGSGA